MNVDVVVLHYHSMVAWYENGQLVFTRDTEDFIDSLHHLVGKNIVSLTHQYVNAKGLMNHCDGDVPNNLSVFASDELE